MHAGDKTYGYVNLPHAALQPDDAYDQNNYASVRIVSAEDGFRRHVGLLYSLFD